MTYCPNRNEMISEIKHYGVLGMKWGRRRTEAQLAKARQQNMDAAKTRRDEGRSVDSQGHKRSADGLDTTIQSTDKFRTPSVKNKIPNKYASYMDTDDDAFYSEFDDRYSDGAYVISSTQLKKAANDKLKSVGADQHTIKVFNDTFQSDHADGIDSVGAVHYDDAKSRYGLNDKQLDTLTKLDRGLRDAGAQGMYANNVAVYLDNPVDSGWNPSKAASIDKQLIAENNSRKGPNAIQHYGVLGMKWGRRRTEAQLAAARKKAKGMTAEELKTEISKLKLEKEYRDLVVSRPKEPVKDFLKEVAREIAKDSIKTVARSGLEKTLRAANMPAPAKDSAKKKK